MGVGVEHPVEQDLPQHERQQGARQGVPIQAAFGDDRLGRGRLGPV
jgi:hypothetical protein